MYYLYNIHERILFRADGQAFNMTVPGKLLQRGNRHNIVPAKGSNKFRMFIIQNRCFHNGILTE